MCTHVARVDVAYTGGGVIDERGAGEGRRAGDERLDIEKCSARKIRLRGIVSHCPHPRTSVSLHVKLSTPRVAKGRLTQTRETAVVILHMGIWGGGEEVPVSSGGA